MIIELGKDNETRELLMGNRTTGSQAQVSYQDGVQEAPVTMAELASKSGSRPGMPADTAEKIRSISTQ